jgi:hypothetical protein
MYNYILSPARAKEIIQQAKDKAVHGPWSDQLDKVMSKEECDEVIRHWNTMNGSTNFVQALNEFVHDRVYS